MARGPESIAEEKETRPMVTPFLEGIGFTALLDAAGGRGQIINGLSPDGRAVSMRVKLCWRLGRVGKRPGYSAAQILMTDNGNMSEAVETFFDGWKTDGCTHLLVLQREGAGFRHAALVPVESAAVVWETQRSECDRLISAGQNGRKKKNQAENGRSPTLYLEDDQAPSVAAVFWNHPAVVNLLEPYPFTSASDDTEDDLVGFDPNLLGRDSSSRTMRMTSGVRRDPAVRREVVLRSNGSCENCGAKRDFPGFLDVHHILGAEKSDRFYTCVALCPNCHREAHFSTDREAINRRLLEFASRFNKFLMQRGDIVFEDEGY